MIFSPVLTVPSPFKNGVLDAVNIFARFVSQSANDIKNGLGGSLSEFEVNPEILELSQYLHYSDPTAITYTKLNDLLNQAKETATDRASDEVVCGAHILYLVLANNGDEIHESISDETYPAYAEVLIFLQNLLS